MKKIVFLLLMTTLGVRAAEIPLIDLSKNSRPSPYSTAITEDIVLSDDSNQDEAKDTQEASLREAAQSLAANPATKKILGESRRLRLFLRELSVIQQAAKKAGGDIRVTIEPVGITPDELVGPLAEMNWFDIKYGQDAIVVRSKTEDPYLGKVRTEVAQLEQQRKNLVSDVQSLERLATEWQARLRTYQQGNHYPAASVAQAQPQPQPIYAPAQQGQAIYQPTPKTVVLAQPQQQQQMYPQQMMPTGYENQRVVVPQQQRSMAYPPQVAEQPVPRTYMPGARELPASQPISSSTSASIPNEERFSQTPSVMPRPALPSVASAAPQPQYSDSTVVLAPRANW